MNRSRIGARPIDANPGDRGLPGFYPAVHSDDEPPPERQLSDQSPVTRPEP